MLRRTFIGIIAIAAVGTVASELSPAAAQTNINQDKAEAGGVTTGDAEGFPVQLRRAGSYKLTSNLEVPAGKRGIVVSANNVTIDLNGFRIQGSGVATAGIAINEGVLVTEIRNGAISGFTQRGIDAQTAGFTSILQVSVLYNNQLGVVVGDLARIEDATIVGNSSDGISCGLRCKVVDSTITDNFGNTALRAKESSHVEGNIVSGNGGGISVQDGSTVTGNSVTDNDGIGIFCGGYCTVTSNTVFDNTSTGIWGGGTVVGNTSIDNDGWGLDAGGHVLGYANNTIYGNHGGGDQVTESGGIATEMHPNFCYQSC